MKQAPGRRILRAGDLEPDGRYVDLGGGRYQRHDEWVAEQEANTPSTAEMLEEAIAEALARGASREEVAEVLAEQFKHGHDEMAELLASLALQKKVPR